MRLPTEYQMKTFQRLWNREWLAVALGRFAFGLYEAGYGLEGMTVGIFAFVGLILLVDLALNRIVTPAADKFADWLIPPLVRFVFDLFLLTPLAMLMVEGMASVGSYLAQYCLIAYTGLGGQRSSAPPFVKASTKPVAFAEKHGAYGLHPITQSLLFFSH